MNDNATNDTNKISLKAAIIVGMNAMIGFGVVVLPVFMSVKAGPAGIFSCALSITTALFIGLSLGRVASICPGSGWSYAYPAKLGGHTLGMISAICYLSGVIIAMGFLIQQAGIWAYQLIPIVKPSLIGTTIWLTLTTLVLLGAHASSIGQYVIATLVITSLLTTSLVCWFNFNPKILESFMPHGIIGVLSATPQAIFAFLGFESIISLYSIVRNPQKNIPIACMLSILGVGTLYTFFIAAILFSIPGANFSGGVNEPLANVILKTFPSKIYLSTFILIGILFGIVGTVHSMIWSTSTLFMDVIKKAKSKSIQYLLEKNIISNNFSVILISTSMFLIALFGPSEELVDATVFFILPSFLFSILLLLTIKKEWVSGRNVRAILGMTGCLVMIYFASKSVIAFATKLYKLFFS